jgi:hypothetical protein
MTRPLAFDGSRFGVAGDCPERWDQRVITRAFSSVETFFSALTRRRLRRGVFRSVADLQAAINRYLKEHNDDPKPFVWTKSADTVLAKLKPVAPSV